MLPSIQNSEADSEREVILMKGYNTANGYMGFVGEGYILFASEADYLDYVEAA